MMRAVIPLSLCAVCSVAPMAQAQYITVPYAYNTTFAASLFNGGTYPTGPQTFAGVPFDIPTSNNNVWHSSDSFVGGGNPKELHVSVGMANIDVVHTLIDNWWGSNSQTALAGIEFLYTDASSWSVDLVGNDDIRDYNQNFYTNSINGTTTVEVFNNGRGQRLDKQEFLVPGAFVSKTLDEIVFWDSGAEGVQRIFLGGLTIHHFSPQQHDVPEPGTMALLAGATSIGILIVRRRRK